MEVAADGETVFERSYSLEAGERAIEQEVGPAGDLESVTVTAGDAGSRSGEWAGTACYRHTAVLTGEGLETGYVSPLAGPGDTQHDCYAGDPAPIVLHSETARTATVTVVDHCRESVDEETVEFEGDGVARLEDALTNGGRYDVVVEVEDGGAAAAGFHDACWGLSVSIDGDGDVEIGSVEMD